MPIELPEDHEIRLQRMDAQLRAVEVEIQKAKSAGLDVSAQEANLKRLKELRAGLLRVYGKGRTIPVVTR